MPELGPRLVSAIDIQEILTTLVPSQMYKARIRDLYADVNTKLSEMCGWDTRAHKLKTREGRSQGTPDVICTSAEVADKVVRATFCANICSEKHASLWALTLLPLLVCAGLHRR